MGAKETASWIGWIHIKVVKLSADPSDRQVEAVEPPSHLLALASFSRVVRGSNVRRSLLRHQRNNCTGSRVALRILRRASGMWILTERSSEAYCIPLNASSCRKQKDSQLNGGYFVWQAVLPEDLNVGFDSSKEPRQRDLPRNQGAAQTLRQSTPKTHHSTPLFSAG